MSPDREGDEESGQADGGVTIENPWAHLRRLTPARLALGRAGAGLPTAAHLAFQFDHARARRAVHHAFDAAAATARLSAKFGEALSVTSGAADRATYLQRPDLGRRLAPASADLLATMRPLVCDAVFVIADGLSALAVERHAEPLLDIAIAQLRSDGWRIGPFVVASQARVALGDEVGEILGAKMVAVLIGERPGLSSPDSLGVYLTFGPQRGRTDADRNCISNIRPEGLSYEAAAYKLHYLMTEARRRGLTGVALKDEAEGLVARTESSAAGFLLDPPASG